MEKKTIGQFIAALRKANGLTQQEVADRLAVSNKAVSRWERDECAPDISVIPALAELLGVTCDELLKGERITNSVQAEKSEARIEKQVKTLINRSVANFKNMTGISMAISAVGLICMFGISYGFYRPVIGFAVMLLFEAVAVTLVVIAVNRMKANKADNELFENVGKELMDRYDKCLGNYSFLAYYIALAVVILSIPFILNLSDYYMDSVLTFESYMYYLGPIALILAFVYLVARKPYLAWILQKELMEVELSGEMSEEIEKARKTIKAMSFLQIGAVVVAGSLFIIAPFLAPENSIDFPAITWGMQMVGVCLLPSSLIVFIVYMVRNESIGKHLWLSGVRNLCFIPSGFMIAGVHNVGWYSGDTDQSIKHDIWNLEWLWSALGLALLVMIAFGVLETLIKKYRRQQIG